jgi:type 1 glutamine amidotransferase
MIKRFTMLSLALLLAGAGWSAPPAGGAAAPDKIRVLIIDGQNNHDWRSTTPHMKKVLEETGCFVVDVATTPQKPAPPPLAKLPDEPKDASDAELTRYKEALAKYSETELPKYKEGLAMYAEAYAAYRKNPPKFAPDFGKYQVVLSNYNGAAWPAAVNKALENSLQDGKIGLVIVHAANNSFGNWDEYNKMIGMGWRGPNGGDRLYLDDSGKEIRVLKNQGDSSGHRYSGTFSVVLRDTDHPVTRGMPREWLHAADELYDNMRGPIERVHLLATAYSKGTKAHEPMMWTVDYGKGRVFHTPMGHDLNGMRCIGFITTLARGTEWAATGKVTLPIPSNFPTPEKVSSLPAK